MHSDLLTSRVHLESEGMREKDKERAGLEAVTLGFLHLLKILHTKSETRTVLVSSSVPVSVPHLSYSGEEQRLLRRGRERGTVGKIRKKEHRQISFLTK